MKVVGVAQGNFFIEIMKGFGRIFECDTMLQD